MGDYNKEVFLNLMFDGGVHGFFPKPIQLKSKRMSHWYLNFGSAVEDLYFLINKSRFIVDYAESKGWDFDAFIGVPEGATSWGHQAQVGLALKSEEEMPGSLKPGSHSLTLGRGKIKDHGDPERRYFIGANPKGKKLVVIEDVTTTGQSLLNFIGYLKQAGGKIIAAIGLANRLELTPIPGKDNREIVDQFRKVFEREDVVGKSYTDPMSVEEAVALAGTQYFSMLDAKDILPEAIRREQPREDIIAKVEEEFRHHGVEELILRRKNGKNN